MQGCKIIVLHVGNEESDQTARMRRLTRVIVEFTCPKVHFSLYGTIHAYMKELLKIVSPKTIVKGILIFPVLV